MQEGAYPLFLDNEEYAMLATLNKNHVMIPA
jgi:hypothetical protein